MFVRLIMLLAFCLASTVAIARENLNAPFDAKALSAQEKRVVQAALAFENHYNGLLDGAWGKGSQSALEKMVRARHKSRRSTWGHVSELAQRWDAERKAREWRNINSQGVSFQAPMKIMQPQRSRRGEALMSNPRGLQIRIMPQTIAEALNLANAVNARHAGRDKAYQSLSDNRLIVAVTLENGGGIYMRTNEARDGLITTLVEWTPEHEDKARVMISSIRNGEQRMLNLPSDGTLAALTRPEPRGTDFTFDSNESARTPNTEFRPITRGRGRQTGNAFFVNHTDLLTSASSVRGCKAIELQGIGPARVIAVDDKQGLAVIMSQSRSDVWVDVPRGTAARGDDLVVLGYSSPKRGNLDLRAFRAAVREATEGPGLNGKAVLRESAPNARHGSMVLDRGRQLAGIIIEPVRASRRDDNTFMASSAYLRGFMNDNNILFDRGGRNGAEAMTEDDVRKTMWRVMCER